MPDIKWMEFEKKGRKKNLLEKKGQINERHTLDRNGNRKKWRRRL